ncbi:MULTISPECIES: sugar transporter [Aminobacter]|jgi:predicted small lipoprotein YifL|uniref:Small lipoprotein YifL n=1 Tax=Aminobacter ciceronei TaxID=150723 RepID=A0ABR6C1F6_9HYPH|nr:MULTISPECIES: sugar transporter [Aminobacter]MBA8905332.1 putative small lipoprotein YifL [Aminobacter ciceronei]MBA9018805.1 putative small lipoprotein YifL [Aminobacter ciceronei]MRX32924.1 sugar transporter [Aminobacter sp. MDW-2]QNH34420.1 sugar transporter [Aminobacter sp. MDW-2]
MKLLTALLALATLSACASRAPVPPAPVAAPPVAVQPVVEPLPAGVKPLTVEQDEQISQG